MLQASLVAALNTSRVVVSPGSKFKVAQFSTSGTLILKPNCEFTYTFLSIESSSIVVFESPIGCIVLPGATIALSGTMRSTSMLLIGALHIPAATNVTIDFPVLSNGLAGCSVVVQGILTVNSYFSMIACSVEGSGRMIILQGFSAEKNVSISVNQISIRRAFNVSFDSSVLFQNCTVQLHLCAANVHGRLIANALTSSHFDLSEDSTMAVHSTSISGFRSMMIAGSLDSHHAVIESSHVSISASAALTVGSSSIKAQLIVVAESSAVTCTSSTFLAVNMYISGTVQPLPCQF